MSWMPLTLIVTLICSLFVAIIINPVITGVFVRLEGEEQPKRTPIAKRVGIAVVAVLGLMLALANWKTFVVLAVAVVPVPDRNTFCSSAEKSMAEISSTSL